ncbi:rhamnogalacturonan acetylesterase [Haliscomenobacter sp.]|uniref:rhamnogalacturonan acetylesterase n=1 Tax=Haliscomenobacter sp. TaxID=2717303 RepID=UPI003593484C
MHRILNGLIWFGLLSSQVLYVQVLHFDFGASAPTNGAIQIQDPLPYSISHTYGFEPGHDVLSFNPVVNQKAKNSVRSTSPFFFSSKLAEGNYKVTLVLGSARDSSSTLVRVENRRLMSALIRCKAGQFKTIQFNVHLRDSLIHATGNKIRLKPRERAYFHWDEKLTLEFNGPAPAVSSIHIEPLREATTVFLAGNSTVVDQAEEPYAAWGQIIPSFFKSDRVVIANYAESGEALSSFRSERRLEKVLSLMKSGDYLFIEFGHNDQKQQGPGIGAFSSYKRDLQEYIKAVRAKGGIPVLVTSMHRRNFDANGKIVNTLGDYPEAVRQVAQEEKTALIDLNALSQILYEAWGREASQSAFVIYPANTFPGQTEALNDNTHFNPYGAWQIARCIAGGIAAQKLPLAKALLPQFRRFNPAQPDPLQAWYWPLSPRMNLKRPDEN